MGVFCSTNVVKTCNFVAITEPFQLRKHTPKGDDLHPLLMPEFLYAFEKNVTEYGIDSILVGNDATVVNTITTTETNAVAISVGIFQYHIRIRQREELQYLGPDGVSSNSIADDVEENEQSFDFCHSYDAVDTWRLFVSPFAYPFLFGAQVASLAAPLCGLLSLWIFLTDWCCRTGRAVVHEAMVRKKARKKCCWIGSCFCSCLIGEIGSLMAAGCFQLGSFAILWEPTLCAAGLGDEDTLTCQLFNSSADDPRTLVHFGSMGSYFTMGGFFCFALAFMIVACFGPTVISAPHAPSSEGSKADHMDDHKQTRGGLTPSSSEEQDEHPGILPSSSATTSSTTPTNFVVAFPGSKTVPSNVSYDKRHGNSVRRGAHGRSFHSSTDYPDEDVEMGILNTAHSTSDVSTTSSSHQSQRGRESHRGSVFALKGNKPTVDTATDDITTTVESAASPLYAETSTGSGFLFSNAAVANSMNSPTTRAPSPPPVIDQEWMDERTTSTDPEYDI